MKELGFSVICKRGTFVRIYLLPLRNKFSDASFEKIVKCNTNMNIVFSTNDIYI